MYVYMCVCVYMCMSMYVCDYMRMRICMYVCMFPYTRVYVHHAVIRANHLRTRVCTTKLIRTFTSPHLLARVLSAAFWRQPTAHKCIYI